MPAEAGIQSLWDVLDPGFRRGDPARRILKLSAASCGEWHADGFKEGMAVGFFHEELPRPGTAEEGGAAVRFPGGSDWFSGHFPGNPIVPGVALLALAADAVIERERRGGRSVAVTGVRRVRFRLPVAPEDELTLSIVRMPGRQGTAYSFTLCVQGEAVCSGMLTVAAVSP